MSRTKAKARRGPEGQAFRENAAKKKAEQARASGKGAENGNGQKPAAAGADGKLKGNGKKRKRKNRASSQEADGEEAASGTNGAKRRKSTEHEDSGALERDRAIVGGENEGKADDASKGTATNNQNHNAEDALLVPVFPGLRNTHTVATMSVISSSNIGKKVTRILEIFFRKAGQENEAIGTGKGDEEAKGKRKGENVVMLYAKAPVACKLISIAEIAKREIAKEGGKWFEYCCVGEVIREVQPGKEKNKETKQGDSSIEVENGDGSEDGDEEEAFEVMKTPFERALEREGKPKVRATPVMSLYLSRRRIESLRLVYGEQTNAQEMK